jgi:antitoxin MazE
MKTRIVRIGNSKGVRLPKAVLDQCRLEDEVDLEVEDNHLVIRPIHAPRSGWDQAFTIMAEKGDDAPLDRDTNLATEWDKAEWRW